MESRLILLLTIFCDLIHPVTRIHPIDLEGSNETGQR